MTKALGEQQAPRDPPWVHQVCPLKTKQLLCPSTVSQLKSCRKLLSEAPGQSSQLQSAWLFRKAPPQNRFAAAVAPLTTLGLLSFYLCFCSFSQGRKTNLCFSAGIALMSDVLISVCPVTRECAGTGQLVTEGPGYPAARSKAGHHTSARFPSEASDSSSLSSQLTPIGKIRKSSSSGPFLVPGLGIVRAVLGEVVQNRELW